MHVSCIEPKSYAGGVPDRNGRSPPQILFVCGEENTLKSVLEQETVRVQAGEDTTVPI